MNWLTTFLEYTKPLESPRRFFLWSAIGMLAHVLGRKVWLDRAGLIRVYPGRMWVCLVSDSAIARKTTAIDKAVEFAKGLKPWQAFIMSEWTSASAILQDLELQDDDGDPLHDDHGRRVPHVGLIVAGELGTLLTTAGYHETLPATLNRLSDCPRGQITISFRGWHADLWNPCVGIVAATTPDGMAHELPKQSTKGGNFGRFIWVCDNSPGQPNSLTEEIELTPELRLALRRDLRKRIAELRGPFRFSKQAKAWFDHWYYKEHVPYVAGLSADLHRDSGYYGRRDTHLLCVAMVCAAAQDSDRVLREHHLEWALRELKKVERRMGQATREVGVSSYADFERRLLNQVEKWDAALPEPSWWRVRALARELWRFGGGGGRLEMAVQTLVQAQELKERGHGDQKEVKRRWTAGMQLAKQARA